jgi:release factor glutamine methyltransferase
MTVAEVLGASGLPALDARALLAHVLQAPRERLIAVPEASVPEPARAAFAAFARRRAAGEPLAYLLGEREFYSRNFRVTEAVLIPRPETELLVERALAELQGLEAPRVLDLGTGSGCIAVTLALECPRAEVHATDASAAALEVAKANAALLGPRVEFHCGDWYSALPDGLRFAVIVSNPPYVAAGDPHLGALTFEPRLALTDRSDGLACLRRIVAGAPARLESGGTLVVEHGFDQASAVRKLFEEAGFVAVASFADLQRHERVTTGRHT